MSSLFLVWYSQEVGIISKGINHLNCRLDRCSSGLFSCAQAKQPLIESDCRLEINGWWTVAIGRHSRTIYEMIGVEGNFRSRMEFSISDEDQRMKVDPCGTWALYVS